MQPFRTASQKIKGGHSAWYTEPSGDPNNVRTSDAPMRTGKPEATIPQNITTTPQRPDSRSSSVNYSYPTRFHGQSPPASPTSAEVPRFSSPPPRAPASPPRSNRNSISSVTSGKSGQAMIYDPNSRRMIPKATVDNVEYHVQEAARRQPKKKKDTGVRREGSHLAKGTVARIKGTTVDANAGERDLPKREQPIIEAQPTIEESRTLEEPAVKTIITTSEKPNQHQEKSTRRQSLESHDLQKSRFESPPPSQSASYDPNTSPSTRLGKKPSIVQEEPEEVDDQVESGIRPSQKVRDALDAVPTRQSIYEQPEDAHTSTQDWANEAVKQPATSSEDVSVPKEATKKKAMFMENKPVAELSREGSNGRRSTSNSPARQAHFSSTPLDSLGVRHAPLPRSVSPIKSALKRNSPTPRELSPSEKSSDISGSRNVSPHQRGEITGPRKKSVRVSFDDRTMATVVGESAPAGGEDSPNPPSPPEVKRPWYSNIGRSKRREYALEDDEIMKPRPALPSFGSVREKRIKDLEERPLVQPIKPSYSPTIPSSPELHPSKPSISGDTGTPEDLSLGQSNDHVIGSILAQEHTSRNAPNISRFREPLPPVVTSVEGSGYISDSLKSSDSDDDLLNSVAGASDTEEIPSTQPTQLETQDNSLNNSAILEEKRPTDSEVSAQNGTPLPPQDIPEIAITQPSPKVPEQSSSAANKLEERYFDLPGGFPNDESTSSRDTQTTTKFGINEATSDSAPTIFEPKAVVHHVQSESLPQTTLTTTTALGSGDNNSTDDSASLYSDACEDLSDMDGFMSIDAVVESPVSNKTPSQLPELPGDVPEQVDMGNPYDEFNQTPPITKSPEPPRDKDDWEQAKAFWRSLSAEKRRQLEREAIEEAGTEGDREDASPIRRNSSRKKTTQRQPIAIEPQSQTSTPPAEPTLGANPDRTYMVQPGSKANHEPITPTATSSRMRSSLRAAQPDQSGLRKTMRSQPGTGQANRPSTSHGVPREKPTSVLSKPNQRQSAAAATQASHNTTSKPVLPIEKPTLQRRGSDASDSSFKRSRATRNSGGFSMRNSMRPTTSSGASQGATKGSGRFSLRSLSPTGSAIRQGSATNTTGAAQGGMMRHSLRSSSVSSQDRIRSSIHFPSFGRSNRGPNTKRSNRSSRFGDSDDEDEGGVPNFRSRFDDSSDEESIRPGTSSQARPLSKGTLRASAPPAAGFRKSTPVPELDEDSPQLPEELSDNEMPSPLQSPRKGNVVGGAGLPRSTGALGTGTLTRSRSGRGGFNSSVSMPAVSTHNRRSSLMGILRRNKKADQTGGIQRSQLTESAARRDTKLERSNEQLSGLRSPTSPRLQKRNSVKRDSTWPLDEHIGGEGVKRSSSAANLVDQSSMTQRPDLNGRRTVSMGLPTPYDNDDNVTVDGVSHKKKKKFGTLRRMFGLDD